MTTCPFLRRAEHCIGYVSEAPADAYRAIRDREIVRRRQEVSKLILDRWKDGAAEPANVEDLTDLLEGMVMLLVVRHGGRRCVFGVEDVCRKMERSRRAV